MPGSDDLHPYQVSSSACTRAFFASAGHSYLLIRNRHKTDTGHKKPTQNTYRKVQQGTIGKSEKSLIHKGFIQQFTIRGARQKLLQNSGKDEVASSNLARWLCAAGGRCSRASGCAAVGEGRRRSVAEDIRRASQTGKQHTPPKAATL